MHSLTRVGALSLAVLLAGTAGGCRRSKERAAPQPDAYPVVIFSNFSLEQADVYAVPQGGVRVRLGTVFAGRTDTLVVRSGGRGSYRPMTIIARRLATPGFVSTGSITIGPGEAVAVSLPPDGRTLSVLPVR